MRALAFFVAALVTTTASAQPFNLESDVTRVMHTFDVPGIAIAIVQDGKVVTSRGFGVRKLGDPAPVDSKTLFQIASNTKAFTAATLAMLVDEGKLSWDDPVTKYVPDFQMADAYATHEMTIRDLLVHRSGLGTGVGDLLWWPTTTFTTDEIIAKLRDIPPATSFRSRYAYDNLLYIVAGKVIAARSGKSWEAAIHEKILAPIGMTDTTTSFADNAANPDVAGTHSKIGERTVVVEPMAVANAVGAVGISTTADDIAKWMQVLLDGGKVGGKRLYSEAQARELWIIQTPIPVKAPAPEMAGTKKNFAGFGLGFVLQDYHGQKIALHGGWQQGVYTQVILAPASQLGIAIFTNAESEGALTALQYRLLDQYLRTDPKITPTDWIGIVSRREHAAHAQALAETQAALAAREAASTPSLALTAYDGDYQDAWYGAATIRHENNKHILLFSRTPTLIGELEHFQHDTFIVHWRDRNFNADAYVTFALNPDGSIAHMRMAPVSGETDNSYDFADLDFTPVPRKP